MLLRRFSTRIHQIHFSEVNSQSRHSPVSIAGLHAYEQVASELPSDVPLIIESPASLQRAALEVETVEEFFKHATSSRGRMY